MELTVNEIAFAIFTLAVTYLCLVALLAHAYFYCKYKLREKQFKKRITENFYKVNDENP